MKKALITGVTGQDGSYLAELLLGKGYEVHGLVRRTSSFNRERLNKIYQDLKCRNKNFFLHYGDMIDSSSLVTILAQVKPDEIYDILEEGENGSWYKIKIGDLEGWVSAEFVTKN